MSEEQEVTEQSPPTLEQVAESLVAIEIQIAEARALQTQLETQIQHLRANAAKLRAPYDVVKAIAALK